MELVINIYKQKISFFLLSFFLAVNSLAAKKKNTNTHPITKKINTMKETIKDHARSLPNEISISNNVLAAFDKVKRHHFVLEKHIDSAYEDRPLPIGHGQTISQPFIVALMTELLKTKKNHKILEVGTGSGFQAAILSALVKEVYTIEIIKELHEKSNKVFKKLKLKNIGTKYADGYDGWEDKAPFDSIIVTAAAAHVPKPLIDQLKIGGHMVIPIGPPFQTHYLKVITKLKNNKLTEKDIIPVRFVPFTRKTNKKP